MIAPHGMHRTTKTWGKTHKAVLPPRLKTIKDAFFVPEPNPLWGVYREDGRIAPSAALYHGPRRHAIYPEQNTPFPVARTQWAYDPASYFYCGAVYPHYGHCLLSTLSRYWIFSRRREVGNKILFHGAHPFSLPFLAFWLRHCGLSEADFVTFEHPTRVRQLTCVGAAFEELLCAHDAFGDLCRTIARNARATAGRDKTLRPVYVSKSRVSSGVSRFVNEDALERELDALGVRIVHPETLPFAEQIRLFHEAPLILGTAGSAIHTSLFVEGGCNLAVLTNQDVIHGNNILIDRITGSQAVYLTPSIGSAADEPGFQLTFMLTDVAGTARGLLEWGLSLGKS